MQKMSCTSCGADLQIENSFIRAITCQACGASYVVSGSDTLDATGKTARLVDYPSRLSVGMSGKIRGRSFTVLGRIRYAYADGFWEEWQIAWDDGAPPDWLEEDEGLWTVYRRERIKSVVPAYNEVKVGSTITVNNQPVFITEKRTARVSGSEGQFSSVFPITGNFGYVTGASNNRTASINYWEDEIELSIGDDLEFEDMVISRI